MTLLHSDHHLLRRLGVAALLLLALGAEGARGADYVDPINMQAAPAGRQNIYELNIGSFTPEGTLAAAQMRLAELKRLGIDIVWLMPVYPRGGGINSPYAATDFMAVNPAYGTVADLRRYVEAAHALHMQVWLDWVPNHTATDARWVTTHPEYYVRRNGQMVHPNNYGDVYQLNYANPDLVSAMNTALKFWIDEADVDGFRCDYISSPEIPVSYWQATIPMLRSYKPGKVITMLGESDLTDNANLRLQQAGFDYDYAWGFQTKLARYGAAGTYANPLRVYVRDLQQASEGKPFARMLYTTNHDQNWNEPTHTLTDKYGANRYLLTVLTHTLCGMPMIYNGEEVGGNQALNYFQDTKIDWTARDDRMRHTLRTLAALRHALPALADRSPLTLLTTNRDAQVLAYQRGEGEGSVVVLLNPSATAQTVTVSGLSGTYSEWLHSDSIARGPGRHQRDFAAGMTLTLPSKGYIVMVRGTYPEADASTADPTSHIASHMAAPADSAATFTLSGVRVPGDTARLSPGIYISGGRKFMVR